jgi:predicted RNase H-related nuclease YkuK (DUF458 family)
MMHGVLNDLNTFYRSIYPTTHYYIRINMGSQTFTLTMEDYTIILNALHYYKRAGKRGRFLEYDNERINNLRDKLAYQLIPSKDSKNPA